MTAGENKLSHVERHILRHVVMHVDATAVDIAVEHVLESDFGLVAVILLDSLCQPVMATRRLECAARAILRRARGARRGSSGEKDNGDVS